MTPAPEAFEVDLDLRREHREGVKDRLAPVEQGQIDELRRLADWVEQASRVL
jgi:hypothetical protein